MSNIIKTKAIVLHQMPIKDHDKRIILFSKDYGKMVVFANGAKRGKSPLLAGTQPFVFGEFHMLEGRDSYTLRSVDIDETFYEIRNDMNTLAYGLYLLEVTMSVIQEMDPNEDLLRLLYVSLLALKHQNQEGAIIRMVYEFRALNSLGFAPDLSGCMECGEMDKVFELSVKGGLICQSCQHHKGNFLTPEGIEVLRYFQSAPLNRLYHFKIEKHLQDELDQQIKHYFKNFIPHKYKSLDIIEIL